jgi:serine/threonine-protein kinase
VVNTQPPRPSDVVAAAVVDDGANARHATQCGTTPAGLRRTLRGDLDAIVAKALKKEAADRYGSVTALADDLQRYLWDQPIAARPGSVPYRTAKFVRRHAAGVATTAAVVLLVAGMATAHTRRLAVARDRAEREAGKAVKVRLFTGPAHERGSYAVGGRAGADPGAFFGCRYRASRGEPIAEPGCRPTC